MVRFSFFSTSCILYSPVTISLSCCTDVSYEVEVQLPPQQGKPHCAETSTERFTVLISSKGEVYIYIVITL